MSLDPRLILKDDGIGGVGNYLEKDIVGGGEIEQHEDITKASKESAKVVKNDTRTKKRQAVINIKRTSKRVKESGSN